MKEKNNFWLVKSEPVKYSWDQFIKDKKTVWDGVRNYQARNNLKAMKKGDLVFWYHSNLGMEIVGIAKVVKTFYQDPTTTDANWVVVDLSPVKKFNNTVTLAEIRADTLLQNIGLIKQSRLSVMPVSSDEFEIICKLGNTIF